MEDCCQEQLIDREIYVEETPVPVETVPEIINCPKCGMKGILDIENTNWFCCVNVSCPIARFLRYFEYEEDE